jgi:AraC-like DNA-binding protein
MLLAQRILTESPIPVSELAPLVGYKDRASFSRAFTRYYGANPDDILAEPG